MATRLDNEIESAKSYVQAFFFSALVDHYYLVQSESSLRLLGIAELRALSVVESQPTTTTTTLLVVPCIVCVLSNGAPSP